jgi:hypothetical protein
VAWFRWQIRAASPTLRRSMIDDSSPSPFLAPLQQVMLRDSLVEGNAGHHVEQVEIAFAPGGWRDRVAASWAVTVAHTEALRIAFTVENGEPVGVETVEFTPPLRLEEIPPVAWDAFLTEDRHRPLLAPHEVPWRATYWPQSGRFLWTFHHALLDGRSITTVLRSFLARLGGESVEELALAKWHPPTSAALTLAERMFRKEFPPQQLEKYLLNEADEGPALRFLGDTFRQRLETTALAMETTTATLLVWAWGQTLAEASGTDTVLVEQVRAGAPQKGTAGFTMLTLPVVIPRAAVGNLEGPLRNFRKHLLALRAIEGAGPGDFPPGVFPDVDRVGSSVIMVEHATPQYLLATEMIGSLALHESKGETLMATAHILPDLRLEVEGPGRHGLLDGWVRVMEDLAKSQPPS